MVLKVPHVSVAEFRAAPTLLDTNNLRPGVLTQGAQDAELRNVLLRASAWADNYVSSGGFAAHAVTDRRRGRVDANSVLWLNPSSWPVLNVSSVAWADRPGATLTAVASPLWWVDDGALVSVDFTGVVSVARPYVEWSYTAGYVSTVLGATATSGATSITVADPTGIVAGAVLRLWDPGVEETVTVASTYVSGSTTVPLTAALASTHTVTSGAGGAVGVSSLPEDVHLAVIMAATALLMRPDSTAEDAFPDTSLRSSSRDPDPRHEGSGLIVEAKRILRSYRKVF